jgi:hypothetical protein
MHGDLDGRFCLGAATRRAAPWPLQAPELAIRDTGLRNDWKSNQGNTTDTGWDKRNTQFCLHLIL